MWKVGSKHTMRVACNPESNFPISIELDYFGGNAKTQAHLDNTHGMWFGVDNAMYLVRELVVAIVKLKAAEHRVQWMGWLARISKWFGTIAHH